MRIFSLASEYEYKYKQVSNWEINLVDVKLAVMVGPIEVSPEFQI